MRAHMVVASAALLVSTSVLLAAPLGRLAPKDIQTTFFNGKPFTASTTSNVKYKMVFMPEGTMTREALGKSAKGGKGAKDGKDGKAEGAWRLSADGFCSTWKGSKENCYRVHESGQNKWAIIVATQAVAYWSK